MVNETTKDLYFFKDDDAPANPFVFIARDKAAVNQERWVFAALSHEEAKEVYEFLSKYF